VAIVAVADRTTRDARPDEFKNLFMTH
jgi:hypothetical protein